MEGLGFAMLGKLVNERLVYAPDARATSGALRRRSRRRRNHRVEPSQREWGALAAQVADPDGHLWMILVPPPPDWTA